MSKIRFLKIKIEIKILIFEMQDETLKCKRTRQIIRYRATVTLRRPQIKQYTASNEGDTKPTGTSNNLDKV